MHSWYDEILLFQVVGMELDETHILGGMLVQAVEVVDLLAGKQVLMAPGNSNRPWLFSNVNSL